MRELFLVTNIHVRQTVNMIKKITAVHSKCLLIHRIRSFLSIRHAHGDLYKHLGIDSSTDLDDRYSNLFLNAYKNRHAFTENYKMI